MSLLYPQGRNASSRNKVIRHLHVCHAVWSPAYVLGMTGEGILNDRQHVLHQSTLQKYNTRSKDCLWWFVSPHTIREKRVVRSWAGRRLRCAIVEALRTQGLDDGGRVLADSSSRVVDGLSLFPLKGTLRVTALPPLVSEKYSVVQEQATEIVSQLISQLRP